MDDPLPTSNSVLEVLTRDRIVAIGREFRVAVPPTATKEEQIETLTGSGRFGELIDRLFVLNAEHAIAEQLAGESTKRSEKKCRSKPKRAADSRQLGLLGEES